MDIDDGFESDEGADLLWTVSVESLRQLTDPMKDDIWGYGTISPADVLACADNSLGKVPFSFVSETADESREYHIARISWLAENGWDETSHPVSVDLYPEAMYDWHPIVDGNHRFAASLFSGRESLQVSVSGDIDYAFEVLSPLDA